MGKDTKHLCKWKKKERNEKLKSYQKIVVPPRFECRNCGRVASGKKWLCDPARLPAD